MRFRIISHPQKSEAWHHWRFNGIGSSEASSILGFNKFKSASELLSEKLNHSYRPKSNSAMLSGIKNEIDARRYYEIRSEIKVTPLCIESKVYSWLHSSLDGICINSSKVVEIKCGESNYDIMAQTRSVPLWHKPQVQHILATSGYDRLDLWCWHPGKRGFLRVVERDDRYIDSLLDAEQEFWFKILRMR